MAHAPRRSRTTRAVRILAASATLAGVVAGASVAEAQVVTSTTSTTSTTASTSTSSTTSGTGSTTTSTAAPTTTTSSAPTSSTTAPTTSTTEDMEDIEEIPAPDGANATAAASVTPGQNLVVSGTACSQSGVPGDFVVIVGNPPEGPFVDVQATANADGTWSVSLTIPATFPTGPTLVRSGCIFGDTGFIYDAFTTNVVPAAAAPVPGRPTFTG